LHWPKKKKIFFGVVIAASFITSMVESELQPDRGSESENVMYSLELVYTVIFSGIFFTEKKFLKKTERAFMHAL
jgi:hypothetical protein